MHTGSKINILFLLFCAPGSFNFRVLVLLRPLRETCTRLPLAPAAAAAAGFMSATSIDPRVCARACAREVGMGEGKGEGEKGRETMHHPQRGIGLARQGGKGRGWVGCRGGEGGGCRGSEERVGGVDRWWVREGRCVLVPGWRGRRRGRRRGRTRCRAERVLHARARRACARALSGCGGIKRIVQAACAETSACALMGERLGASVRACASA